METQMQPQPQNKSTNAPSVATKKFAACKECGDVDGDTRSGAVICRRCGDAALAHTAFTD
jgi:ribosomal protein S14